LRSGGIRRVGMVFFMVHTQTSRRCTMMALSDTTLRCLKAGPKDVKKSDGRGLYLLVKTSGGRLWRWNYSFDGKQKTLALGSYPDVSLRDARDRCDAARKLLAQGIAPARTAKHRRRQGRSAQPTALRFSLVSGWSGGRPTRPQATTAR
jgi:hypothetical protein